ncbi:hypothetical protein AB4Z48_24305 [Cupriavidus sp. 2TAF22]|uniref:hypothetical protein n=1 Tax=unclassified Cupriavidus TaxID=2640874 RepID=UPI003F8DEFC8
MPNPEQLRNNVLHSSFHIKKKTVFAEQSLKAFRYAVQIELRVMIMPLLWAMSADPVAGRRTGGGVICFLAARAWRVPVRTAAGARETSGDIRASAA